MNRDRHVRAGASALLAVVPLVAGLAACSSKHAPPSGAQASNSTTASTARGAAADPDSGCASAPAFRAADFPDGASITNPWLPLTPGRSTVLTGSVREDDGELHPHRIVSIVTDLTKVIGGVTSAVVYERDFDDGELQESELAFEAQDASGRVWNMGEYPEEYDEKGISGAPSTWAAGIDGAQPGLSMPADPTKVVGNYVQGKSLSVHFYDCAKTTQTYPEVCVKAGCYQNVLVVDEWGPLDPSGGHQLKYYASGTGSVKVGAVGGTAEEVLKLESVGRLTAAERADARAKAIEQDERGYHVSPKVYGKTPRIVSK